MVDVHTLNVVMRLAAFFLAIKGLNNLSGVYKVEQHRKNVQPERISIYKSNFCYNRFFLIKKVRKFIVDIQKYQSPIPKMVIVEKPNLR